MTTLVNSLPTRTASNPGTFNAVYQSGEQNTLTNDQITTARNKYWPPRIGDGSSWEEVLPVTVMAYACYTPSNTTLTFYYDNLKNTRPGTTYDLPEEGYLPEWNSTGATKVVINSSFAGARPTTTFAWFYNMSGLTSILGMNYLNTSEVTDMSSMFQGCSGLTSLDLSSFNTSKVTTMESMFWACDGLTSLNLNGFNTSKVTTMQGMFCYCSSLTNLDLSSFNTSMVTKMSNMFTGCSNLTELDLGRFNTSKVTSMSSMFSSCSKLTELDLSSFNTSKVADMGQMFVLCDNLTTIYVGSGWTTAAVAASNYMFYNCTKIRGEKGTTYNANHLDAAYAHIDGGTSNPGYLSSAVRPGDVNGDGQVNITDVTVLINIVLTDSTPTAGADVNGDGNVNITDVTTLITMVMSGT